MIRPDGCGDTLFADTTAAYDSLPVDIRDHLQDLRGRYSYLKLRSFKSDGSVAGLQGDEVNKASDGAIHPLITQHPITGRRNIYANPSHTEEVLGLSADNSSQLLSYLFDHVARPEHVYRHIWEDGDLVMWDNRGAHHRGTGCPSDKQRLLVRVTVSNDEIPVENAQGPFSDLLRDRARAGDSVTSRGSASNNEL